LNFLAFHKHLYLLGDVIPATIHDPFDNFNKLALIEVLQHLNDLLRAHREDGSYLLRGVQAVDFVADVKEIQVILAENVVNLIALVEQQRDAELEKGLPVPFHRLFVLQKDIVLLVVLNEAFALLVD